MENINKYYYDTEKRQLNLTHRNLRSLDAAIVATFADCTEYLDLSHNRITNISWIYEFPHLKCLIMDNNRLREAHFENLAWPLTKIQTLMLNKNEFSDLKKTASILQRLFPNVEYLSLHGNAMCPDNLLLQPFSEFVPYEYNYYRTILLESLPNLKFLDHFSLNSLRLKGQVNENQINLKQQQEKQFLTTIYRELWSKLKGILKVYSNQTPTNVHKTPKTNGVAFYGSSLHNTSYEGLHSEGNRHIGNSDL